MIRQSTEGKISWFNDLAPSDIPHPLPKGISIHIRGNQLGLESQGLVGAIPLGNGDTLQIIPKIGRVNFLRLLFKAEGIQHDLEREYEDFVQYFLEDEQNVDAIVARQLLISVAEILYRSPKQGRIKRQRRGVFATGQMEVVATALNVILHNQDPVVYFLKEKTLDIPENRVISEAIIRAWPLIEKKHQDAFGKIHDRWLATFPRSLNLSGDLHHIEQGFALAKYGGPRDYYKRPLMLSQIVLGSQGLGFNEEAVVEGEAMLLNTADIFEKYLRSVISAAYSEAGYIVTKRGVGVKSLYTDGSFELQPDIVVSRHGRVLLLLDAKYKEPTAADHYQMLTYLTVNGVKNGVLLAPHMDSEEVIIREFLTDKKLVIREVYLPMSNLTLTEDFLGKVVERFG